MWAALCATPFIEHVPHGVLKLLVLPAAWLFFRCGYLLTFGAYGTSITIPLTKYLFHYFLTGPVSVGSEGNIVIHPNLSMVNVHYLILCCTTQKDNKHTLHPFEDIRTITPCGGPVVTTLQRNRRHRNPQARIPRNLL